MVRVSIIIVNYNSEKYLRPCLESLINTTFGLDCEIIVIDNASKIDIEAFVELFNFPRLKVVRNRINAGFARAINKGIAIGTGEYYLLLNPDTVIYESAVEKLVEFLDSHPEASCVGPLIHSPNGGIERSTHGFPTLTKEIFHSLPMLKNLLPYSGFPGKLFSMINNFLSSGNLQSYWNYDQVKTVDNITGACMLVRRKAVEEVGVLDESFFIYSEEVDWNYRFQKAGWKVYFTPDAEILHYFGQCTGQKPRQQKVNHILIERFRGMIYYFNKHYGFLKITLLRLIYIISFTLRLAGAFLKLPFGGVNVFKREVKVFTKIIKITLFGPWVSSLPVEPI